MNSYCADQARLTTPVSALSKHLKLEVCYLDTKAITLADLLDDSICEKTLQDFAKRIHAKNLSCASSLFVKYWSTVWILPFLYCQAASLTFVKWQSSILAVNLSTEWYWDRTLQLTNSEALSLEVMSLQDIGAIFDQLNCLFQQIAKVGRVSYALLWENAAVRVVQFYHSWTQQNISPEMQEKLQQQQQLIKMRSAQSFHLAENPFVRLWSHWHPELATYMRKKCCLYFQLDEAGQTLCRNCPSQLKQIK
ncbi:MAG TPA: (2Fe-2S)-binding protein [Acinetobacter sp.]|nr:(2Fe-2S)-binding protein [Acinetobacter sp.]